MKPDKTFRSDNFTSGPAQFLPNNNDPLWKTRLEAVSIVIGLLTVFALTVIGFVTVLKWLF